MNKSNNPPNIMVYIATAPTTEFASPTQAVNTAATRPQNLDSTFDAALEHARRLTAMFGTSSPEVAIAWETVDELQHARVRSMRFQSMTPRAAFLRYCEENPNALEARIYDD